MYNTIKTELSNSILTITLNRPEKLNAFNPQMRNELLHVLDYADNNDDVRVIILTGEGRGFCSGADLSKGEDTFKKPTTLDAHRDGGGVVSLRIFDLKKPIIAAINGPAVGVGITMTLPMDIRIASSDAKMGFVFTRRGIIPEACSGWFLPKIVGISQALEWIYTGRIFTAQEALEYGLVSQVVSPDKLLETARDIAEEISENTSSISIALSRQLMWRMMGENHPIESHKIESKIMFWTGQNADSREGVNSFIEKRKPEFPLKVSEDMPNFYPWWDE